MRFVKKRLIISRLNVRVNQFQSRINLGDDSMSTRYLELDESRKFDIIFLGRVAVDFNPAYSELVKEEFKPLKKSSLL